MADTVIDPEIEKIVEVTKKGFDLQERIKNRGLRRGSITLYLDEEKGAELGWVREQVNSFGDTIEIVREGVLGELDSLLKAREQIILARTEARKAGEENVAAPHQPTDLDEKIVELEGRRDALIEEMNSDALIVEMRAVPPVIQKDCRRKARETLGINEKNVPDALREEFNLAYTAHLMTVMIQKITDTASGAANESLSYDDAIALMDYLPPGQFSRLDAKLGEIQFTDAISASIESQEDFS